MYYTITELGTEGESESLIVLRTAGVVGTAVIKAMKNEFHFSKFLKILTSPVVLQASVPRHSVQIGTTCGF